MPAPVIALLRRYAQSVSPPTPRVLGIDDWSLPLRRERPFWWIWNTAAHGSP
ncbi:hypothetical protein KTH_56070 [Thermosporothrix hazakensis]|nr:hypothetical protein KTH_56070 [Thermosporothrix hazakensis]